MPAPPLGSNFERQPAPCMPMSAMPRDGISHCVQDGENWSSVVQKSRLLRSLDYHLQQLPDARSARVALAPSRACRVQCPDRRREKPAVFLFRPARFELHSLYHRGDCSIRFDKVWLGSGIRTPASMLGKGRSRCLLILYSVESLFAPQDHVDRCYIEAEFKSPLIGFESGGRGCGWLPSHRRVWDEGVREGSAIGPPLTPLNRETGAKPHLTRWGSAGRAQGRCTSGRTERCSSTLGNR